MPEDENKCVAMEKEPLTERSQCSNAGKASTVTFKDSPGKIKRNEESGKKAGQIKSQSTILHRNI